jgi:hypothetical protein
MVPTKAPPLVKWCARVERETFDQEEENRWRKVSGYGKEGSVPAQNPGWGGSTPNLHCAGTQSGYTHIPVLVIWYCC